MDKQYANLLANLEKNKEYYISNSSTNKDEIKKIYPIFSALLSEYIVALNISMMNNQNYMASLKNYKMDPYIAGGLAQGIGGLGAGIYASYKTAENNKKIEESRIFYEENARDAKVNLKTLEHQLVKVANHLISLLKEDGVFNKSKKQEKKITTEELYEKYRKQILNNESNINLDEMMEFFLSLDRYKDSKKLYFLCKKKKKQKMKKLIIIIISIIIFFIMYIANN